LDFGDILAISEGAVLVGTWAWVLHNNGPDGGKNRRSEGFFARAWLFCST
jgi:hypothetical protein